MTDRMTPRFFPGESDALCMDDYDVDDRAAGALGRAWLDDRPWRLLTRLTELDNRLGGHPGDGRAAELVAEAFEACGVADVRREAFETTRWTRGGTDLAVSVPDRGVERAFEAVEIGRASCRERVLRLV